MKHYFIILIGAVAIFTSSCATIFSKSTYPINIQTIPPDARVTITNSKGVTVYSGNSPATVPLKASEGYFKKAYYTVTASHEGYESGNAPIPYKLDGWYWGNLLIGGVIGMLIVDPATGAMFAPETNSVTIILKK